MRNVAVTRKHGQGRYKLVAESINGLRRGGAHRKKDVRSVTIKLEEKNAQSNVAPPTNFVLEDTSSGQNMKDQSEKATLKSSKFASQLPHPLMIGTRKTLFLAVRRAALGKATSNTNVTVIRWGSSWDSLRPVPPAEASERPSVFIGIILNGSLSLRHRDA